MPTISQVTSWKPAAGKAVAMLENMAEAKAIHERLGALVYVTQCTAGELAGTIAYMTVFPSGTAFGAFIDALSADAAWLTFWLEVSKSGNGDMVAASTFQGVLGFEA